MEEIVKILKENNKTISTMESCTGGALCNEITNIPGASEVLHFSAVTYSNEYKIKMGVSSEVIREYTVYSMETANEMSKNISLFTNSNYGVGITGKLNRADINNNYGDDNVFYVSIYDRDNNNFINRKIKVIENSRKENKEIIINEVIDVLKNIVKRLEI